MATALEEHAHVAERIGSATRLDVLMKLPDRSFTEEGATISTRDARPSDRRPYVACPGFSGRN